MKDSKSYQDWFLKKLEQKEQSLEHYLNQQPDTVWQGRWMGKIVYKAKAFFAPKHEK